MKVHVKRSIRLPVELARNLENHARARNASQTAIIEAALQSFLSPDGADRLESALSRRLDLLTRRTSRLEWHVKLGNETLAHFIRFWLTSTPPLPDNSLKSAQVRGKERWERFIESLERQIERGRPLQDEIREDR